jgi:D-serine deaminase-like pyridoxal phosphate-dependent protein
LESSRFQKLISRKAAKPQSPQKKTQRRGAVKIMSIETAKTPSLLLDVKRVRSNATRIAGVAKRNNVRLRPHIKTHKCIEVARIQTQGFDGAITVSTLAEARSFASSGFSDITYAVPVEPGKFAEASEIFRSGVKLNLLTDDLATVRALDEHAGNAGTPFDVFVKIDCGTHRVGVEPESEMAIMIPRFISGAKNINFAGILTHAGHSYDVQTVEEIKAVARHERDVMVELAARLRGMGIEVPTVSIGSTPTMNHIDHLDGIDEIRPGNYIFFDNFQATLGSCSFEDTALTVLSAVIHRDVSHKKIVIDAGGIALSKDRGPVGLDPLCGYGRVLDLEGNDTGMRLTTVSQEHGVITDVADEWLGRLKVGDRLRILANHSCMTAAQHEDYNILENGEIVDRWEIHRGW